MSDYWKKRFQMLEEASNRDALEAYRQIEPSFVKAQRQIEKEINTWVARVAVNNEVTMSEARKLLSSKELAEFKWDVNQYIEAGRKHGSDPVWMKQLENASARFHISKLEALQIRTQEALETAFGNETDIVDSMVRKTYSDGYYKTLYEVQKGFNTGWEVGQIDQRKLDKIVSSPWSTDGKTFSNRIWDRKTQMVGELQNQLLQTCILGKTPDDAVKSLEQYVDKSVKNAENAARRLVMTEQAYFHSESQKEAFKELGVEQYEIVATLDSKTSEICQEMDGQVFDMKDFESGVTAPPFHVYCRSVVAPYFPDDFGEIGQRAARDEVNDKTYYVPADMKYPEWKKAFVDGDTSGLTPKTPSQTADVGDIIAIGRNYQSELSKGVGKEHYDGMHDLIDDCENETAVQCWQKYENQIKVGDAKYKGRQHASGSYIYIDAKKNAAGSSWETPFEVSFHESGHAIDCMNKDKASGIGLHFSARYKDGVFPKTITSEVDALVDEKAAVIKKVFKDHKGDWEWLHQNGYISSYNYDFFKRYGKWFGGEPKYSKSLAYKAVEKEIKALEPFQKSDLSDMMEGATRGKISIGFGHGKKYWTDRMFLGVNDGLATEAFAEMTSATFTNQQSLETIKKYLPESYKIFMEMLDFLVKN